MIKQTLSARIALLALCVAVPAGAQHLPGVDPDSRRQNQENRAGMLREANRILGEWRGAWVKDDPKAVARFYTENALLRLPNGLIAQGRPAIEQLLRDSLAIAGDVQIGMNDWEPGGDFVYISGPFTYNFADVSRSAVTGTFVVLLKGSGGSWKIRTQTFIPDPLPDSATAGADSSQ